MPREATSLHQAMQCRRRVCLGSVRAEKPPPETPLMSGRLAKAVQTVTQEMNPACGLGTCPEIQGLWDQSGGAAEMGLGSLQILAVGRAKGPLSDQQGGQDGSCGVIPSGLCPWGGPLHTLTPEDRTGPMARPALEQRGQVLTLPSALQTGHQPEAWQARGAGDHAHHCHGAEPEQTALRGRELQVPQSRCTASPGPEETAGRAPKRENAATARKRVSRNRILT